MIKRLFFHVSMISDEKKRFLFTTAYYLLKVGFSLGASSISPMPNAVLKNDIQTWSNYYKWSLNAPYVYEVYLIGQNLT